jgi:hypothetical protein
MMRKREYHQRVLNGVVYCIENVEVFRYYVGLLFVWSCDSM